VNPPATDEEDLRVETVNQMGQGTEKYSCFNILKPVYRNRYEIYPPCCENSILYIHCKIRSSRVVQKVY
jgi:hypothetical protein